MMAAQKYRQKPLNQKNKSVFYTFINMSIFRSQSITLPLPTTYHMCFLCIKCHTCQLK